MMKKVMRISLSFIVATICLLGNFLFTYASMMSSDSVSNKADNESMSYDIDIGYS